jgi:hypothetical protein
MTQICDMGQGALIPLRRKACWGFFRPEKSDGFGRVRAKGQHATSRPPKPLCIWNWTFFSRQQGHRLEVVSWKCHKRWMKCETLITVSIDRLLILYWCVPFLTAVQFVRFEQVSPTQSRTNAQQLQTYWASNITLYKRQKTKYSDWMSM